MQPIELEQRWASAQDSSLTNNIINNINIHINMNKMKSYIIIRWERSKRDLGGGCGRGPGQQQLGDQHAGAQAENNLQRQTFRSKKDYTTGQNGQRYRYLQTDIQTDRQWNYLSSLWSWDHSNTVMYTFNIYYLNKTQATDNYNIFITQEGVSYNEKTKRSQDAKLQV